MRRGLAYFQVEKPRLEIVPMIDIMMFLLVFFMIVVLRMIQGTGLAIELPGSVTAQDLPTVKITIGVDKDGTLTVGNKAVGEADLRARLESEQRTSKVEVVIAGDKAISLQQLIRVMDLCRAAGITALGIAAKAEAPGGS
ncbi:MAG: biopolymer transporter ExbD [Burkholderiales bacterium]